MRKKLEEFADQRELLAHIRQVGMQSYVDSLKGIAVIFELLDRWVRCMDEGTPGGIRLAGSGRLYPDLDELLHLLKEAGVEGITWHELCGAIELWLKLHPEVKRSCDAESKRFSSQIADKLGKPCRQTPLKRPKHYHNAVAIYVPAMVEFDPSRHPGMPLGFVVARWTGNVEYGMTEAGVALDIALGSHGFGKLFEDRYPLLVVPVGADKIECDKIEHEVRTLLVDAKYAHKPIMVSGFIKRP
jgi:hypothetical protein